MVAAKDQRGTSHVPGRGSAKKDAPLSAKAVKAAARRALAVLDEGPAREATALTAAMPEPVLELLPDERSARVRQGADSVLLDEIDAETGKRRGARGFVKAVLRVPLDHPESQVYGVWVEVDKTGYSALRQAFSAKEPTRVWGTLATRLPLLEDAYGSPVELLEDGSNKRARVTGAEHAQLLTGPSIGPEQD